MRRRLGRGAAPKRSQFSLLVRHFLERFFNHETASPDGDAKARMVLIAFATGLPGFMVAIYLWPVYHPFPGWPPGRGWHGSPPPYWLQVNHHFFFVVYSFVAMGIATVFEWDLFFPDLLDIFVLTTLPIRESQAFPGASGGHRDPHLRLSLRCQFPCAVGSSRRPSIRQICPAFLPGICWPWQAAACLRRPSFWLCKACFSPCLASDCFAAFRFLYKGLSITVFLMLLLLFPVLSGAVPVLLRIRQRVRALHSPVLVSGHLSEAP